MLRGIVAAIVIGASSGAAAQSSVTAQVPADARVKVQAFEESLRAAVVQAGQLLADRARQVTPPGFQLQLRFEAEIRVRGAILPEGEGALFLVEVPGIEPNMATLFEIALRLSRPPLSRVVNSGNAARPPATEPVAADPVVPMMDPVKEYSDFTHDALVDAMLTSGPALSIREGQKLTLVVGSVVSGPALNPLAPPDKMLYLRMKGEDLIALRQNRITRDEAKNRILEFRY